MRKPFIVFLSFLPALALIVVALVDSTDGTKWLGRDGRLVTSFGNASVTAPIPFQGSLWSVWAKIEGEGNGGGWQTEVAFGKKEVDFVTRVGLHPDFYERGRVESVRVSVEALNNSGKEEIWSTVLYPDSLARVRPFQPVRLGLAKWKGDQIILRMKAYSYGNRAVDILWIEPKLMIADCK